MLKSERLSYRQLTMEDYEEQRILGSDPETIILSRPFESMVGVKGGLESSIKFNHKHPDRGYWICHEISSGKFVGYVCLRFLDETKENEIGYSVNPECWNKGYGTEMSMTVLRYGFEELGLHSVVAISEEKNIPSVKIMLKTGLLFEKYCRYYNSKIDLVLYRITREMYFRAPEDLN